MVLLFWGGCVPRPRYCPPRLAEARPCGLALPDDESLLGTINYYLGTPYKFGGTDRDGMDCSGFVQRVFREALGLELPRTVAAQWRFGKPVARDELAFGDIVFFCTKGGGVPTHSGIYIGAGRFAHASSSLGVTITPLSNPYWSKRYCGARRVIMR